MRNDQVTVLVPARLASSRLPNKPLADIAGQPMIVRVARRVAAGVAYRVVVAADSPEIQAACALHQVECILTRPEHPSGSDRLAEAADALALPDESIVVNVQGDEPLVDPQLVDALAVLLDRHPDASMSTAAHALHEAADFANPNVVKLVTDAQGFAMYFSRAPIPWWRDGGAPASLPVAMPALRHIGVYGYRVGFLKRFPALQPAPLESVEALEQLRALWHGHRICVHVTASAPGPGVDTPADLERVRAYFKAHPTA